MNYGIKVSGEQKVIQVKKAPADKNNKYCVINQEALHKAMKALHKCSAGLPLWMYIAENQNNYIFALSSSHFMNLTGFGKDAYNNAVKALIANGYLVHIEGTKQTYIFFENGTAVKPDIIDKNSPAKENPIDNYREDRQSTVGKPDIELSGEPSINTTNNTTNTSITGKEFSNIEVNKEPEEVVYPTILMEELDMLTYGKDYTMRGGIITLTNGEKYSSPLFV